jgi:hypothetical protein
VPTAHPVVHYEDGFRIPSLPVTLTGLIRHARLFGTESVYETAVMERLPKANLARLRIELDAIDAGRKSSHGYTVGKRRRRSSDETRDAVLALSVDGLVPAAIADKLGLSDRSVRRYLREMGATALGVIGETN